MRSIDEIKKEANEICLQLGVETVNYQSKVNKALNQIAELETEAKQTKEIIEKAEKLQYEEDARFPEYQT